VQNLALLLQPTQKTIEHTQSTRINKKITQEGNSCLVFFTCITNTVWLYIISLNFVFSLRGACVMGNFRFRGSAFWHAAAVSTIERTLTQTEGGIHDESGELRQLQYKTPIVTDS
jgi:hypothetical protein